METLTPVTKEVFDAYVSGLSLEIKINEFQMHLDNYYKEGKLIASVETSSYNNKIVYKVKNPISRVNPKDIMHFKEQQFIK